MYAVRVTRSATAPDTIVAVVAAKALQDERACELLFTWLA